MNDNVAIEADKNPPEMLAIAFNLDVFRQCIYSALRNTKVAADHDKAEDLVHDMTCEHCRPPLESVPAQARLVHDVVAAVIMSLSMDGFLRPGVACDLTHGSAPGTSTKQ